MAELRAAADVHDADWVVLGVRGVDASGVGALVPAVFDRYARVFHPASRDGGIDVRWADVAAANNRLMHPAAEWGSLTGSWQIESQADLWDCPPSIGTLPERLAERLAETLAPLTRDSLRCKFGVWDGWGEATLMYFVKEGTPEDVPRRAREQAEAKMAAWRAVLNHAPTFLLPDRNMHLLEGSLDSISEFYEDHRNPPGIWWPEDRAWCVATDIDLMSTYVGGSHDAIRAVLDDEQVEALAVPVDQSVTWQADAVNPLPLPPY
jgi:hypothetical protein